MFAEDYELLSFHYGIFSLLLLVILRSIQIFTAVPLFEVPYTFFPKV